VVRADVVATELVTRSQVVEAEEVAPEVRFFSRRPQSFCRACSEPTEERVAKGRWAQGRRVRMGRTEQVPALGVPTSGTGGGGGNGSNQAGATTAGGNAQEGGGGGGGAGRIRVNTATGSETFPNGLSPTMASGLATVGTVQRTP
jgi:hypothetical protein